MDEITAEQRAFLEEKFANGMDMYLEGRAAIMERFGLERRPAMNVLTAWMRTSEAWILASGG